MSEPEIEVLRIEGNVTVPKGIDASGFKGWINSLFKEWKCHFEGNIVPQDSPTGMRLYEVKVVEAYQRLNRDYELQILQLRQTKSENDKAYSDLAEQLRQEKESKDRWKRALELETKISSNRLNKIGQQEDQLIEKDLVIKSLRNKKDSPIKAGLKRIWKWFKGLVVKMKSL